MTKQYSSRRNHCENHLLSSHDARENEVSPLTGTQMRHLGSTEKRGMHSNCHIDRTS